MSGGGGGGSQTATNYTSNVPEYAKGAFMDLVGKADALSNTPYTPYTGDRVAQFTPMQQQAMDSASNLAPSAALQQGANVAGLAALKGMSTNYGPSGFSLAGGPQQVQGPANTGPSVGAGSVGGPGGYERVQAPGQNVLQNVQGPGGPQQTSTQSFTQQGTAQNFMNPYMQNVVNIQQREAVRADDIARQSRNARATQAGAFGGSRQAIMEAEAGRNLQTQLGDIQAQGLNQAYQQAQQQFNTEQGLGFQSQQANQRAGLDTSQMGLQAALANQRGSLDLSAQQLQAQQANQRAGLDTNQMGLQASLANARNSLDAGIANQQMAYQYAGLGQQAALANQRAGLDFNNQYLDAQRAGEQSRQFGANLGLEGARTGLQAAQTLGQLGSEQFNQQQGAISTQYGLGNQQRQAVQGILDQQYGDFQAQRDYPYQQIGFMSDLLRGAGSSTRQVYPGPSTMQTLAGLGTAAYGLKNMGGFKQGGKVKAGLADVAPDSMDYADGGIVGYASAGSVEDPEETSWGPAATAGAGAGAGALKLAGDAIIAKKELAARNALRAKAGLPPLQAAPSWAGNVATKVRGGLNSPVGKASGLLALGAANVDAWNTPTEQYRERFGLETDDPTFLGDVGVRALGAASDLGNAMTLGIAGNYYRDKQNRAAAAPPAAKGAAGDVVLPAVTDATKAAAATAASGGGNADLAALQKASMVGAGPKGMTLAEAQQSLAGVNAQTDANVKSLTEARQGLLAKEEAAADAGLAQLDKDTAERGVYGAEREARAKEGLAALEERKGKVKGEALLQAGLAILSADPRRGGWGAIGEGLGVGLKQYRGDIRELAADKERLDEKLSQIGDMRRAESMADKDKRRALQAERNKLSAEAARDLMRIQADFGLKPKYETAVKAVEMSFRSEEAAKERAAAAARTDAQNRVSVGIAALRGSGTLRRGTPDYVDQRNKLVKTMSEDMTVMSAIAKQTQDPMQQRVLLVQMAERELDSAIAAYGQAQSGGTGSPAAHTGFKVPPPQ
jgi:hypothetical protein